MLEDIYTLPYEKVAEIEWTGYDLAYDLQLYMLGDGHKEFKAVNPYLKDKNLIHFIKDIPESRKCIVWTHEGEWVVKLFKDGWYPYHGYESIEIVRPRTVWSMNKDIDRLMTFENDPRTNFEPDVWDIEYELVWHIDPRFNPLKEKVWAISCRPMGQKIKGTKDMGYVVPLLEVEYNGDLPWMDLDLDVMCPPFYDLTHECAYMLDKDHSPFEDIWVVRFRPAYKQPDSLMWIGTITPTFEVVKNPVLPDMNYALDFKIPWRDFWFEHAWILDPIYTKKVNDEVWAYTVKIATKSKLNGTKVVDYVSPLAKEEYNPDLGYLNFKLDYVIPEEDMDFLHVWYLDTKFSGGEKIWAAKMQAGPYITGEKEMGVVTPVMPKHLDVIFISYNEPNAEDNWKRVLEKAPWAKRVDGVEGIFKAHKEAAKVAETDMFYVVDGDAWLDDSWKFNFQPGIFDRDCAYVWTSCNPINDLTYGYGGVKLFSKRVLMKTKRWTTLDMFTGVMPKLKVIDRISNTTAFNTDEFSTWRSAFRECVKLSQSDTPESKQRLAVWTSVGKDKPFGKFAIDGAKQGIEYANQGKNLKQINDYNWLKTEFNKQYDRRTTRQNQKSNTDNQ